MSAPNCCVAQSHPPCWRRVAIAIPSMLASGGLFAQIEPPYVDYGPLANPIPTLSGWTFLLLAMFMLAAVWQMKRKDLYQGSKFLIGSLVVGALACAASGVELISNAYAPPFTNVTLENPSGGRQQLYSGMNCIKNGTNVDQELKDIVGTTANAGYNFGECSATQCSDTPPTVLGPDKECNISFPIPIPPEV